MKRYLWIVCAVAACGQDEADPATVRERISALVPPIADGAAAALDAAKQVPAMQGVGSLPGINLASQESAGAPGAALAAWLNQHLFIDAAYEGDGVYRITGANVCGTDAVCAAAIDRVELRIGAAIADDGLDLVVLVGPERKAPLELVIRPYSVKGTVNVAEVAAIATALGIEGIATAEGKLSLRLERIDMRAWVAEIATQEALRVTGAGGAEIDVAVYSALSAILHFDAPVLELLADLKAVTLRWPWEGTILGLDLPGLTAQLELGTDIWLNHLGFGDRTAKVTLGPDTLLALDLNPNDGREVAISLVEADGIAAAFISPRLDLRLTAHLQPLLAHGKTIAAWLLDEEYEFHLGTMLQFFEGGIIEVWGEPMSLHAGKAGVTLEVPAEMCLYPDALTEGEQPLLGKLAVSACPVN